MTLRVAANVVASQPRLPVTYCNASALANMSYKGKELKGTTMVTAKSHPNINFVLNKLVIRNFKIVKFSGL